MRRIRPHSPLSHGVPRVDDQRVLSGIIFVNRNGLRWRDAPSAYGSHKTLYTRWYRWSRTGVFARVMLALAQAGRGCCQTDANSSQFRQVRRTSARAELPPLGQSGSPCGLIDIPA